MAIDVSIIMGHYSEDEDRNRITKRCVESVQQFRNEHTEFIISANGHYDGLNKLCDVYIERNVDTFPGKTFNIGVKNAKGNVIFFLCNDVFLYPGAVEESVKIVKKYKKYLSTPVYRTRRKFNELPMVDGYYVNKRVGSDCVCLTKEQYEDIGPMDEIGIITDATNYTNRWIKKGYAVMLTPTLLGKNIGEGKHSFTNQLKEAMDNGFVPYRQEKVIWQTYQS